MAGFAPVDFGNALASGIGASSTLRDSRRKADLYRREEESQQYIEPALRGDEGAFGKLAASNPQVASSVATMLSRLDARKQAAVKDAAEFTTQMGMGVLNAPPEAQASAYESARTEAQRRGMDITSWPAAWGPQAQGWVQFNVNKAIPVQKWFEQQQGMPTPIGGGGAPSAVPGGAPSPNRDQFISMMTPHALEVAKATGLDPRLVIAQSGLETGFGSAAPGNNYFGIKSHDRPGGQTLATTEAGPGGALAPTQASFRTYADPGSSARDYADFLKTNPRYQPVLTAQGLDAQIDAMGKSGYATDPQYGAKLRQIAQTIQLQPAMGTPPPQIAQAGGFTPTNMPAQSVPGGLPQMPGGAMPPGAGGQGDSLPGQPPGAPPIPPEVRGVNLPPGAQMMGIKGVPVVKDGTVLIRKQDGSLDWVPLPQRKEPGQGGGPFAGTGMDQQAYNIVLQGNPADPAYAAAYAHLASPRVQFDAQSGQMITIRPNMGWARPPMGAQAVPAPAPPPDQGAAPPAATAAPGAAPPQAPTEVPIPGGGTATVTPAVPPIQSRQEMAKLREARAEAEKITKAGDDFVNEWKKASLFDRGKSMTGATTNLNTAYNAFALLAKGETLFNLGVLNGPDLEIIRRTLPDPSQIKSGIVSEAEVEAAVGKVLDILRNSVSAKERQLPGAQAPAAPPASGPAEKGKQQFELKKKYGLE